MMSLYPHQNIFFICGLGLANLEIQLYKYPEISLQVEKCCKNIGQEVMKLTKITLNPSPVLGFQIETLTQTKLMCEKHEI